MLSQSNNSKNVFGNYSIRINEMNGSSVMGLEGRNSEYSAVWYQCYPRTGIKLSESGLRLVLNIYGKL